MKIFIMFGLDQLASYRNISNYSLGELYKWTN